MTLTSRCSTSRTFLPTAKPVRLPTRKIWVSTAIVGCPNAVFSTTLAVLRPTPGKASKSALLSGTMLLCFSMSILQALMTFSALELYKPMVFIYSFKPSTPSA